MMPANWKEYQKRRHRKKERTANEIERTKWSGTERKKTMYKSGKFGPELWNSLVKGQKRDGLDRKDG